MDQIKIGRFIAERRKRVGLTQMQLAEKLKMGERKGYARLLDYA